MTEGQDIESVRQTLQGNQRAFEAIVDRYQKPIYNVAYRIVSSIDEAEDITQTVFIKAYENLQSYNNKYKFFSWLYRIAINESLNHKQSHKRIESLKEHVNSNDPAPDELLYEKQSSQALHEALNKLKSDYKLVIILKHLQGLSYSEISEVLCIPEKTVKSRLFSARQHLRDKLSQQL